MKTFANTGRGFQLDFLLNHESTRYKLVSNLTDFTPGQIHFLYFCAKRQQDELNNILGNSSSSFSSNSYKKRTPLDITEEDSREDIIEKIGLIKASLCH